MDQPSERRDQPEQGLTRRQLLAGGLGLAAAGATGRLLAHSWQVLLREDLVPGEPPTIQLAPHAWHDSSDRLTFAAIGDNGSGGRQAMAVAGQMARSYARAPYGLVVLLGDMCYYGPISERFEDVFLAPMRPLIDAGVAFELAVGNHDGDLFVGDPRLVEVENILALLGTPARYYASSRGPVDFFHLDSVGLLRSLRGGRAGPAARRQLAWLDGALDSASSRWRIVCSHHPIHSSGLHGPTRELAEALEPLLVRHRVDLFLAGHDHHYERTVPIDGVTHVVSGAGCKLTAVDPGRFTDTATSTLQFLRVEVDRGRLRGRAIGVDGSVLDRFELRARQRP